MNTNNLWVNLPRLREVLAERDGVLGLPMIVNRKTVDPGDTSTPEVFQLETAMGAAIGVFEGAPRAARAAPRFAPVKTTDDLLGVRSDAYVLTTTFHVALAPERDDGPPVVELDSDHYKLLRDFDARFPSGPPSLVECERLVVDGDVRFGRDVVVRGAVEVDQEGAEQLEIEDGAVLEGEAPSTLTARSCSRRTGFGKIDGSRRLQVPLHERTPPTGAPLTPTPKAPDVRRTFPECRRFRKIRPMAMEPSTTESTVYIGWEG